MYNPGFLVVEIAPANNETNVPLNTDVRVKFSFDMIATTISTSTMLFNKVNGPSIPVAVSYDRATRTAIVKPTANLEQGTQYRLTIVGGNQGVTTITGEAMPSNKTYEFLTAHDVSVSLPGSLTASITDGYVTLSWLAPASYNADKELKYKVAISTSSLDPVADPGAVIWPLPSDSLADITGLTVNTSRALPVGRYYAYVAAVNGTTTSSYAQSQFLIEPQESVDIPAAPDGTPIGTMFEVHVTYPEADTANITPDGIKILFTTDVDMGTISKSTFYVIKAAKPKSLTILDLMTKFAPDKAIPATLDVPAATNLISLSFDPETIEQNSEYTVILRETVKSTDGQSLGEAYIWSFTSTYSPLFGDAERIRDDIKVFIRNVPDKVLYRYMYDVSLNALDVVSTVDDLYNEETYIANPPRYLGEYVRFQVGYDLVVNAITQEISGIGSSRTLGDLTIQPNQNISQVNQMLQNLKDRIKRWEDELHGYHNRGYAKPGAAVRGESVETYPDYLTRTELSDPAEG